MAVNNGNCSTYFGNNKPSAHGQKSYSQAEIMRMRQDAIRRTNELHSRSTSRPADSQSATYSMHNHNSIPHNEHTTPKPPPSPNQNPHPESKPAPKGFLGDLLGGLGLGNILSEISGETAIILMLIVLLVRDKADMKLVLALCYLLI